MAGTPCGPWEGGEGERVCTPPWLFPRLGVYLMVCQSVTWQELRTDADSWKGLCLVQNKQGKQLPHVALGPS